MAGVEFSDAFNEASDTNLVSHTPDTGTGWTVPYDPDTTIPKVLASADVCTITTNHNTTSCLALATVTLSGSEYDVACGVTADAPADDRWGVAGRCTDEDNGYYAGGSNNVGVGIWKRVAGVETEIARDSSSSADMSAGNTYKLEIRAATKKFFEGATERLSSSDNAITATANGGMWWGNLVDIGHGDVVSTWQLDNFKITTVLSGTSLGASESSHGHTSGGVDLTQVHDLGASNGAHAHSADAAGLTQTSDIGVAESSHSHSAENVTVDEITGAVDLGLSDGAHAHAADGVELTVTYELGASDASHSHISESVDLAAVHALNVADSSHAHSVEAASLTYIALLDLSEVNHALASDNVGLAALDLIGVSRSVHNHSAGKASLATFDARVSPITRTYTVPPETRFSKIAAEVREISVPPVPRTEAVRKELPR